jgi:hypothetical protein
VIEKSERGINEVLCRPEIRQVNKTAVDENATNIFYIIQGNVATITPYSIGR